MRDRSTGSRFERIRLVSIPWCKSQSGCSVRASFQLSSLRCSWAMPCRQLCNGPSQFPFHQRRARVSSNCSSIVAISLARLGVGARRSGRSTPMRARDIAPHVSYSPNDGAWNGTSDVSVCPVIPWDIQTPSGDSTLYLPGFSHGAEASSL